MKKIKKIISVFSAMALLCGGFFISCANGNDSGNDDGNTGSGSTPAVVLDATQSSFTLEAGKNYSISLSDISLAASKTFSLTGASWSISDPYIASVTSAGKLTPLTGGTTKLTSGTTTVTVTVEEPDREVTSDPFDLATVSENLDIFCCGDSIMRDYGASDADQYGLGQALSLYFDSSKANVVTDIANGGRSSRLFYNETSRWPEVVSRIKANNAAGKKSVVILSFGHNDQRALTDCDSNYGAQFTFASNNPNGTVAGTHYDFMEKYIVEARELGAVPVCVTPFVRGNYDSTGAVSAYGKHDWSNKTMTGDSTPRGNYPEAMRAAAKKQNAILVDMTELSAVRVAEYNAKGQEKYFYVDSDNTHERTLGGLELGKIITENLKEQGYLTSYILDAKPRVMVNKSSLAFGRLLAGANKTLNFKVSSFQNTSGKITVTAPAGFGVSLSSSGTFTSSLDIDTTSDFIGAEIFVKFSPSEVVSYNGDLTVTHTAVTPDFGNTPAGTVDGSTLKIALTGAGKDKSANGTDVTVTWAMIDSKNAFSKAATSTSEDLTASEAKLVGLVASTSKTLGDKTYSRVTIDNTGNVWPVNDTGAKKDDCYMEFAVPASGVDLTVNKISFDCCSSGGSNMAWSAYYSTNEDFSNPDPICEIKMGTKEVITSNSVGGDKGSDEALGLPVEDGSTLYVRIYPAYKDTKENSGRTFIISNIKVEGLLQ